MTNINVGLVGLGNMGSGIAHNYMKKGVSLNVWDTDETLSKR